MENSARSISLNARDIPPVQCFACVVELCKPSGEMLDEPLGAQGQVVLETVTQSDLFTPFHPASHTAMTWGQKQSWNPNLSAILWGGSVKRERQGCAQKARGQVHRGGTESCCFSKRPTALLAFAGLLLDVGPPCLWIPHSWIQPHTLIKNLKINKWIPLLKGKLGICHASKYLHSTYTVWSFPGGSDGEEFSVKKLQVWSLGQEDPLEKEMTTHSSILTWKIPWTEEPNGLQSTGWQRVRHNWACLTLTLHCIRCYKRCRDDLKYVGGMPRLCANTMLFYVRGLIYFFLPCTECRILVPQPGMESVPSAGEAWSLTHWATSEVPKKFDFDMGKVPGTNSWGYLGSTALKTSFAPIKGLICTPWWRWLVDKWRGGTLGFCLV